MRIGFGHGKIDGEYEFHLHVDPLVSVDALKRISVSDILKATHSLSANIKKKSKQKVLILLKLLFF